MNKFSLSIGLATLVIFGLGGYVLIEWVQNRPFREVLLRGWSIPMQLLIGSLAGGVSALLALLIITRDFFKKHKKHYYELIASRLKLNWGVIIFISLCAGIGEEIFFRAGLQPVLGLWITAVIFVALHGYLPLRNWQVMIYGISMLLIIAGFGYLYRYTGLFSVMMAHSFFDFILFAHIYRSLIRKRKRQSEETERMENPSFSSQ